MLVKIHAEEGDIKVKTWRGYSEDVEDVTQSDVSIASRKIDEGVTERALEIR